MKDGLDMLFIKKTYHVGF
uniref:Uncharacterized protein n=1 Tax=Anguilla anguilla TaxID=7936 RepID=A0A0E9T0M0_ANGAN